MRASNVDSLAAYDGVAAIVADFASPGAWPQGMTGVFDHTVANRLQALPPCTRIVHPLPPQA